jgi:YVTN family beta-propeller protein
MSLKGKCCATSIALAAIFGVGLFGSGCGEYFRPVANPIAQPGGDPQHTRHALVVSRNGACVTGTPADCSTGTAVIIDVSGDSAAGVFTGVDGIGRDPVYAVAPTGTDYVVNEVDNSVSPVILGGQGGGPNVISLPAPTPADPGIIPAVPVFAASARGKLFVAESGRNMVAVIDTSTNILTTEIPVGPNPRALVATPDGTQLYCLNQGDNTVTVILPANNTVFTTIALTGTSPVWGTVSNDGTRVFVANQGTNSVSVINTLTDTVIPGTAPCTDSFCVGTGPNYIVYDPMLNRVYVTSPPDGSISIIENATGAAPTVTKVSLAPAPCNGTTPISITALADGTRAYVADQTGNSVCILNTTSNTFTKRICLVQEPATGAPPTAACVGSAAPVFIASDSDSFRVYTANQYQTGPFTISSICRGTTAHCPSSSAGVVTVTTTASNPFAVGEPVTITGVSDASFDGVFGITSVKSTTEFTYSQPGIPDSSFSGPGATAAILPYVSLIQTSSDATVRTTSGGTIPLTIPAGGTPTFIVMTP